MMKEYIEREAAIYGIMPIYKSASLRNRNVFSTARKCLEAVENTPAADVVEVRHAYWRDIQPPDQDNNVQCWCSACGAGELHADGMIVPYCWKCGAKMDSERKGGDE